MSSTRVLTRRAIRNSHRATNLKTGTSYTPSRCISQTANLSSKDSPPLRASPSSPSSHPQDPPRASPTPSFHNIFASPTWSVRSLLPPSSPSSSPDTTITPTTLHHLLRLSALPPPATPAQEATLLHTLHTQLHFVRAIQAVNTTGIAPLTSIREETASAADAVTLDTLRDALAEETVVGFRGRPRRHVRVEAADGQERVRCEEEVLVEERTKGRRESGYYVVDSGRIKGGG